MQPRREHTCIKGIVDISESLNLQGDKSAKRGKEGLLALLAPRHLGVSRIYDHIRNIGETAIELKDEP